MPPHKKKKRYKKNTKKIQKKKQKKTNIRSRSRNGVGNESECTENIYWMGTPAKIPRNCFYVIRVQHTPPFVHKYSNAATFTSSSSSPSSSPSLVVVVVVVEVMGRCRSQARMNAEWFMCSSQQTYSSRGRRGEREVRGERGERGER